MIGRFFERRRFMREHRWTHSHVSGYLDAELTDEQRLRLERHTELCPQCRRVLATLRRTLAELRGLHAPSHAGVSDGVIERLRRERG